MTTEILSPDTAAALAKVATVAIDRNKLAQFGSDWADTLAAFKAQVTSLDTPDALQWAADRLTQVATALKDLEEERMLMKRPLLDDGRVIDAAYKETRKPAEDVDELLRRLMKEAANRRHAAEKAALAQAATLAAAGDGEACQAALAAVPEAVKTNGASATMAWEFRIVNAAAIPRSHMTPDIDLLDGACKLATKRGLAPEPVAGVEFYQDAVVRRVGRGAKK